MSSRASKSATSGSSASVAPPVFSLLSSLISSSSRFASSGAVPYTWVPTLPGGSMASQIPLVDYLVLEPEPHLVAHECTACGARYFDRRNACAGCFGTDFRDADVATTG